MPRNHPLVFQKSQKKREALLQRIQQIAFDRVRFAGIWDYVWPSGVGPRVAEAMSKGLLQGLTLAAFAALGTMTCATSAGAATPIDSCTITTLNTLGATYVLTANLTATTCGDCLVVANDSITIDLAGHTISGSGSCGGDGVTDGGTARPSTTVKNGTITGFQVGVNLGSSTRSLISNLTSSDNSANGIVLGPRSIVKGCLIVGNGQDGIIIGDFSQVQDCTIGGDAATDVNGGFGISGASRMLITDNTVVGNLTGIVVGNFSTVSFNESSGNTVFGVLAGNHSLVISNRTNRNGSAGVATSGLSSVSYNTSNENGGGGIDAGRDGSFDGTRSLVTGNTTDNNGGFGVETWCPSTVTNNNSSGNGWNNRSSGNGSNYNFNGPGVCHTKNNN